MENSKASVVRFSSLISIINSKIDNDSNDLELLVASTDEEQPSIQAVELKSQMEHLAFKMPLNPPMTASLASKLNVNHHHHHHHHQEQQQQQEQQEQQEQQLSMRKLFVSPAAVKQLNSCQRYSLPPPQPALPHPLICGVQQHSAAAAANDSVISGANGFNRDRFAVVIRNSTQLATQHSIVSLMPVVEDETKVGRKRRNCQSEQSEASEESKPRCLNLAVGSDEIGTVDTLSRNTAVGHNALMTNLGSPPAYPIPTKQQSPIPTKQQNPIPTKQQNPIPTKQRNPMPTKQRNPMPTKQRNSLTMPLNLVSVYSAQHSRHPEPSSFFATPKDLASFYTSRLHSVNPTIIYGAAATQQTTNDQDIINSQNIYLSSATDAAAGPFCSGPPKPQLQYVSPVSPDSHPSKMASSFAPGYLGSPYMLPQPRINPNVDQQNRHQSYSQPHRTCSQPRQACSQPPQPASLHATLLDVQQSKASARATGFDQRLQSGWVAVGAKRSSSSAAHSVKYCKIDEAVNSHTDPHAFEATSLNSTCGIHRSCRCGSKGKKEGFDETPKKSRFEGTSTNDSTKRNNRFEGLSVEELRVLFDKVLAEKSILS